MFVFVFVCMFVEAGMVYIWGRIVCTYVLMYAAIVRDACQDKPSWSRTLSFGVVHTYMQSSGTKLPH